VIGAAPGDPAPAVGLAFALRDHPDRVEALAPGDNVAAARRWVATAYEIEPRDVVLLMHGKALGDALLLARPGSPQVRGYAYVSG
jgi:hypothetical protein